MRFLNSIQTKEQRRTKYNFLKLARCDVSTCRKMRDFTVRSIIRRLYFKQHGGNENG